jgi:hypothetical protein
MAQRECPGFRNENRDCTLDRRGQSTEGQSLGGGCGCGAISTATWAGRRSYPRAPLLVKLALGGTARGRRAWSSAMRVEKTMEDR